MTTHTPVGAGKLDGLVRLVEVLGRQLHASSSTAFQERVNSAAGPRGALLRRRYPLMEMMSADREGEGSAGTERVAECRTRVSLFAWHKILTGRRSNVEKAVIDAAATTLGLKRFASAQIRQEPRPTIHLYAVDPTQSEVTALDQAAEKAGTVLP
jgi:hypothetical protein